MPHFEYQAQCPNGTAITGMIEAADHQAAMAELQEMHLVAIELTAVEPPRRKTSISSEDFVFFNEQLASLAAAGICLDEGLRQMANDVESPRLRRVIRSIADEVERGTSLDEAVAAHEAELPVLYSRVVRAGLTSGQLPATLLNLSQHLRRLNESRRIILEIVAYPLTVFIVALAVVTFVMVMVIPRFEEIFYDFDTQLPGLTSALLEVARAFPTLLAVCGAGLGAVLAIWLILRCSGRGRGFRERLVLATPLIGQVLRTSLIARFSRSLALMVSSGVQLPDSLRLATEATGSPTLIRDGQQCAAAVERGDGGRQVTNDTRLIPRMLGFVIEIATGRNDLPEALFQLAKAYEQRTTHAQSLIRVWLVPASLLVVALTIGLIIVALFLPLVALINSVSGG